MWVAQEYMLLAWTHGEKSGLKFLNRGIIEQTGNIIKLRCFKITCRRQRRTLVMHVLPR